MSQGMGKQRGGSRHITVMEKMKNKHGIRHTLTVCPTHLLQVEKVLGACAGKFGGYQLLQLQHDFCGKKNMKPCAQCKGQTKGAINKVGGCLLHIWRCLYLQMTVGREDPPTSSAA